MSKTSLYKIDSKGKMRIWTIWTVGGEIKQEAGILGGALVPNSKFAKPKNVGKSNETSESEQAISEMNSTILGKLDEGYFKTQDEASNTEVILPMLAKSYEDYAEKIDWDNCFMQPKLDGMRCLAIIKNGIVTLKSRDGKTIENMQHIIKSLEQNACEDMILDGELYTHGLSFQDNMRLIKKYREGETEKIHYHIYDIIDTKSFGERYTIFKSLNAYDWVGCEEVPTSKVNNIEDLKSFHAINILAGYEGSIIRHGLVGYKIDGRSANLLKYKEFQDVAIKIKDVEPADQRPEWGVPVFEWKGAIDDELRAGVRMTHEERINMLKNKKDYIGKTAEVRFFEYSEDGVPRFPIMVGVRLDK